MANPRDTLTNAADSAPGVDDGRAGAKAPRIDSKPGGRKAIFWIVGLALAVLIVVFLTSPNRLLTGSRTQLEERAGEPAPATASQTQNPAAQ